MGLIAALGGGLLLGLALMIWGLRERSKRHAAEREADKMRVQFREAKEIANANAGKAFVAEENATRLDSQIAGMRGRLAEMRTRLAECGDPKAIQKWLDDELGEKEL